MRKILEASIKAVRLLLTCVAWIVSATHLVMMLYQDPYIRAYSFLTFTRLIIIGLMIILLIVTWQKYNYHRFGKLDRRKFPQPVTADNMGEIFAVAGEAVEEFQLSTCLSLELVREYDSESDRIIERFMMLADTSEYEISLPYTVRTPSVSTPQALENVAV